MEMNSSLTPPKQPPISHLKPHTSPTSFRNADDTWYSENENELLDIWHIIEDSIKSRGLVMLDKCRFNHFCTFVMSMTTTLRDSYI